MFGISISFVLKYFGLHSRQKNLNLYLKNPIFTPKNTFLPNEPASILEMLFFPKKPVLARRLHGPCDVHGDAATERRLHGDAVAPQVLPPTTGGRTGQSGGRRPPGRVHSLQGGDRHLRAQYGHPGGEYYLQVGELVKVGDAAHQDVFTVFKAVTVTYERSMVTLEVSTTSR